MGIENFAYLTTEEAITLHILLMREWEEVRFGVDKKDLLESALNRPKQSANFENADIFTQSATLCFGLIKNHPWLGGNKRTATFLMETFLEMNGFELICEDSEIVEMVLAVESDLWKTVEIENWLKSKTRKINA